MKKILIILILLMAFSTDVFAREHNPEKSASAVGNILGLVVDTLNEADALTSYYYLPIMQNGWTTFSAQHKILNVTVTYEATNDLPAVDNASAEWSDVTQMLTDGAAASFTATGFLSVNHHLPWSRLRIKRVTTNASNELELRVTRGMLR